MFSRSTIRKISLKTSELIDSFCNHVETVLCVKLFSHENSSNLVISSSIDGMIILWDSVGVFDTVPIHGLCIVNL